MMKNTPTLRIEYTPGKMPRVTNVESGEILGGIFGVTVEMGPREVVATLQTTAEVFIETSNVDVQSTEYEALLRLARFVSENLILGTPEVRSDLEAVERLLAPPLRMVYEQ